MITLEGKRTQGNDSGISSQEENTSKSELKVFEDLLGALSFREPFSAFSIPYEESIFKYPCSHEDRSLKDTILNAVDNPIVKCVALFERHAEARFLEVNALVETGKWSHVFFESEETQQPVIDKYMLTGEVPLTYKLNAVVQNEMSLEFIFQYNKTAERPVIPVACDIDYKLQEVWEKEERVKGLFMDEVIPVVAERRDREIVAPKVFDILRADPSAKILILRGRSHEQYLMPLLEKGLSQLVSEKVGER